jgi:hypothetical protein
LALLDNKEIIVIFILKGFGRTYVKEIGIKGVGNRTWEVAQHQFLAALLMELFTEIHLSCWYNQISTEIPSNYTLYQNYPNPFNPSTNFRFSLPKSSVVKIKIFDVRGKELETIINEYLNSGALVNWDASKYSSGVYFYRLQTENFSETKN